jgi:phosphotransferase system enzyme I (PtsP)
MAEPIAAQDRLDKIVEQIAANMVAEVCSVYVLRADNVLELTATIGLKREAVHQTALKVGEGLVGLIAADARCLNLPNAQSHPAFAYKPETGEEMYNAFLGVPILRAGRTLGVLVVQNKAHRTYQEEEVEVLQTTAMIIAEMIAAGGLEPLLKPGSSLDLKRPMQMQGIGFGEGVGLGHVVLHEPRVVVSDLIADDARRELNRLEAAIEKLRISVDDLLQRSDVEPVGEHRDVLEAYRMFAYDRGWVRKMEEAVKNGLTAEASVEKVQSDTRARMLRQTDPYLRERLHDFDALANRLIRELMGRPHGPVSGVLPKDAVIVARNMGAADLFDYDRDRLKGLVLEEGAATSHISIVARSMSLPIVGQIPGVVSLVETGDAIVVDGELGIVHVRPAADVESAFAEKVRFRARRQAQYRRLKSRPSLTKDGQHVQ